MEKNHIQKSIDQIGLSAVTRYLPKGMKLHNCPIHGGFVAHYKTKNPICSLCSEHNPKAEGTTASDVELFIDLKSAVQKELASKTPLAIHTQSC